MTFTSRISHSFAVTALVLVSLSVVATPAWALGPDEPGCTTGGSECNEGTCANPSIGCYCSGTIAEPMGTCRERVTAGNPCIDSATCRAGLTCNIAPGTPGYQTCVAPEPEPEPEPTIPTSTGETPSRTDFSPASFGYRNPLGSTSIPQIIGRIVRAALGIVGAIFLAVFIYGGALWMTAGGDASKVTAAKRALVNAVIGLVVTIFSYSLLTIVFQVAGSLTGS